MSTHQSSLCRNGYEPAWHGGPRSAEGDRAGARRLTVQQIAAAEARQGGSAAEGDGA
jgi:hypothetical protein